MTLHRLHRRPILITAGFAAVAALMMTWATAHGVGASRDSVSYFRFARILLGLDPVQQPDGTGPDIVLTHYPPLYPALLAIGGKLHLTMMHAARWLNVGCFAVLAGGFCALINRLSGSTPRQVIGGVLLLFQPAIVDTHFWAASEPLFYVCELAAVWLLVETFAANGSRSVKLAGAAGLALSAGIYTRYVGGALMPAACVALLLQTKPWRDRWLSAGALVVAFVAPVVAMVVGQRLLLSEVGHRTIEYHSLTAGHWTSLLQTFERWFVAIKPLGSAVPWSAGAAVLALATLMTRRQRSPAAAIAVPAIVIYTALLLFSVAFIDNATPVDDRLLSPVALVLLCWLVVELPSPFSFRPPARIAAACTLTAVGMFSAISGLSQIGEQIIDLRRVGFGFNHVNFRNSPLVRLAKKISPQTQIYSNYPEAVFLHTGHDAAILPGHPTALGRETSDPMAAAFERMQKGLVKGGYVVYFGFRAGKNVAAIPVSIDELKARIPLKTVAHTNDGTLLKAIPATRPSD